MVTEGVVKRSNRIRVLRDNVVIYEGELESLRRFGMTSTKFATATSVVSRSRTTTTCEGDQIEVYETVEIQRTL